MFFYLSKLFWFFANPANLFLILLMIGCLLLWTKRQLFARRLLTLVIVFGLFFSIVPLSSIMLTHLEDRFPATTFLPDHIDGVIVAGGVINPALSHARGSVAVGSSVERLLAIIELGNKYPQSKLIFSAGSGDPLQQELKEAHYVGAFLEQAGFDSTRVIYEDQARNTVENAELSYQIAQPKDGENWVLVTSAFHMPRAIGTFRHAGWKIIPYPVDYMTSPDKSWSLRFNLSGISRFSFVLHEYLGLLFYWLTGKTDTLYPGPDN